MANNLIEEQILKGRGRISLLADGHDIEEINESLETIEKKNPSLAEDNLGPTGASAVDDSASTLGAGSSESSLVSEPRKVIRFFDEPIEGSNENPIPLPTAEDRAFLNSVGSITEKVMNAKERANYLYQYGYTETEGIEGRPQDLADPVKVLEAARRMSPEERRYYASAFTDLALDLRASEDEDYLARIEPIDSQISSLEEKIKANEYEPIMTGSDLYRRQVSADEQRSKDEQELTSLYFDKRRVTDVTKARYQADNIEEAYRLVTEMPERYETVPRIARSTNQKESQAWLDWVSRVQKIEEDIFNHGQGIAIDIDDDGKVGFVNRGRDTMLAIELMCLTALDMALYTTFTVQEAKDKVLESLAGSPEIMRSISGTQNDLIKDYANWSDQTRKEIRSRYTQEMVPFEEELLMGDAEWYEGLARWQNLFNAIESSPYSAAALATFAATGNPYLSAGAISSISAMVEWQGAKKQPVFDSFYVGGEQITRSTNPDAFKQIDEVYATGNAPDDNGVIMLNDGRAVRVRRDDFARFGYSFSMGTSEGVPEVMGLSMLTGLIKNAARGSKAGLKGYLKGWFISANIAASEEALEETATAVMQAWIREDYLDEHLSSSEYIARIVEQAGSGSMGGLGLGSGFYAFERGKRAYDIGGMLQPQGGVLGRVFKSGSKSEMKLDMIQINGLLANSDKLRKAKTKYDELKKKGADINEINNARAEFEQELRDVSTKRQDGKALINKLIDLGELGLAEEIMEAAFYLEEVKNRSQGIDQSLVGVGTLNLQSAEEKLEKALEKAEAVFATQEQTTEVLDEFKALQFERLEEIRGYLDLNNEQIASDLGVTVKQLEAFTNNAGLGSLAAAMAAAKETNGLVKIFATQEEYNAAASLENLSDRQKSLAQFVTTQNEDGTTSVEIHLSPNASAADILEEVIHLQVQKAGYTPEQLRAMADELLAHENKAVRDIAEQRRDEYGDDAEEIVAGVLRTNPQVKFDNRDIVNLNNALAENYTESKLMEVLQKQSVESFEDVNQYLKDYYEMERMLATAAVTDLAERFSSLENLSSISLVEAADDLGFDLNTITLDQVGELTAYLNNQVGVSTSSLTKGMSAVSFNDPQIIKLLNDVRLPNGEKLLFRGRLRENVAVMLMKVDDTGNSILEYTDPKTGETSKIVFKGGIEMEEFMAGNYDPVLLASSNPQTASRFENALRRLAGDNNFVAVLYSPMGVDAVKTSEKLFTYSLNGINNAIASGEYDIATASRALLTAFESHAPNDGRFSVRYVEVTVNGKGQKSNNSRIRFFDTEEEANSWVEKNKVESQDKKSRFDKGENEYDVTNTNWVDGDYSVEKTENTGFYSLMQRLEEKVSQLENVDPNKTTEKRKYEKEVRDITQTVLDELINVRKVYKSAFLTTESREKILKSLKKDLGLNLNSYMNEIKAEVFKEKRRTDYQGQIAAMSIGRLANTSEEKGRSSASVRLRDGERTQFEHGVSFIPGSVSYIDFTNEDGSLRTIDPASLGFIQDNLDKPQKHNNEIIDQWVKKQAAQDKVDAKSSKFMGLPETSFDVSWVEAQNVGHKGLYTSYKKHTKTFNDGWHFWNWWVWYTGNGSERATNVVGGWSYRDQSGNKIYIEENRKIPTKKQAKYMDMEPGYKSWEQRSLDKNIKAAESIQERQRRNELEYNIAKTQLNEKLGETNLTYGLLDQYVGASREFSVDDDIFGRGKRTADYVRTAERLGDIMLGINEMSEGDIISWFPKTYDLAGNPLDAYSKDHTLMEIAFKEVQRDKATLQDVRGWLQRYARFENKTDALVHTVQKTADGYRISVGLNVHNSVVDELGQAYDFSKGYKSAEEIEEIIFDSQNGVYGEPRDFSGDTQTDVKSSRILPNRYYDLKGQIGTWPAFSKWAYGFFVNDKKPILDIQQEILDEYGAIPEEYNFEEIEQLMYGRTRFAMENLDEKMQTARTFMMDNDISHVDLSQFMYALHAQERNQKILKTRPDMENGSGMYDEDAAEIIRQLDSRKMREAAKFFYDILDDTRTTMLEYGLETPERVAAWNEMYQSYVPLQGFAEDEMDPNTNAYPNGGAGMGIFGSKVKAAYGRESEAANVLANIVMQNALVHQQAEKNRVVTSLHGLFSAFDTDQATIVNMEMPLTKMDQNGDQVSMTMLEMQADPHTVPVRINGKQEFVWFKDPYYAQILNGATKEEMNTFMRVMRIPVQFLRGVYTQWNPEFFVPNFSRDIHGAVYNASSDLEQGKLEGVELKGFKREMISNTFSTLNVLLNESALGREMDSEVQGWYSEWKEDGGQTGWNYVKDISQIMSDLSTDSSDLSAGQKVGAKIFESAQSTLQFVEGVNDAFENSIRLSAYITARKRGASRQQAAVFSKNITVNFNRQGEAGPAINTMYLFFNAAIQGTVRTGKSLITPKTIVDENGKETKVMSDTQKIAGWMAGFSAMLTMVNLAVSGEDPDDGVSWYDKIPDYEKQRNMIICYGPDRNDFIKIPLPYGFNLVNNVGSTTVETATGHRSIDEALMFMAGSTISSTSPITIGGDPSNPVDMAVRTAAPTIAQVPLDIAMNRSSFSGAPVTKTQSPYGPPKPESEMMMRSPEWLQQIARDLNFATGGSEFVPGDVDINFDPMVYALDQYGGGPLNIITEMFGITEQVTANVGAGVENAIENRSIKELAVNPLENIKAKDIPIAGVTSTEASEYYDFNAFYENRDIVEQLYKELKEVQETGQPIQEEPGRYNGIQILKEELKETDKQLKQIREKERELQSTLYDAENFVEFQSNLIKLTELREAKRRLMARWNKRYNSFR